MAVPWQYLIKKETKLTGECPVCEVKYETEKKDWKSFFRYHDSDIKIPEPLEQARSLALVVERFESEKNNISPIQLLFFMLARASSFVHFSTWNITNDMLGAFAMLATKIKVRGIIGGISSHQVELVTAFQKEIDGFELNIFGDRTTFQGPHQKLIVFDGLIAIEGSANLTLNAWQKAADFRESLRVITEIDEVKRINNLYFSRHFRARQWADNSVIDDLPF